MTEDRYVIRPIGFVESPLVDVADAPKQGDEGAPDAWIVIDPAYRPALHGLETGTDIIVLTWLDRADRSALATRPRDDPARPLSGVFATRSQHRPNPIGLHTVTILAIDDTRILVRSLEALDRTPVIDIKPTLGPTESR
jgi:tRNA-Thr(GGU) m(6)t(6)A37 methyltransferase TsaA